MSKRISRETKIIVFTFCLFIATNLLDSYKSEHAPQVQSNFKVVESVVSDPSTKRIAFINGHHGTSNDFRYLSELLNFKFAVLYDAKYGHTDSDASRMNDFKVDQFFCDAFDIVAVGDVNTDGRFLLKRLVERPEGCNIQKLIMITTNRVDFGVGGIDQEQFFRLLDKAAINPKITWREPKYAKLQMKRATNTINYRIIRPFGYSNLPQAPKISKSDSKLPVLFDHPFTRGFLAKIVAAGIKHKTLPHSYGGPTSLAQYKCFISVPYQTSTMKDYENLAHGVVMLVPTPRYLRELMDDPTLTMGNLFSLLNVGDDWYKYIEQYTDEMKDWFYQFDSIDDLKNILKRDVIDTRNVRQRAPEWWESKTKKAIEDWKEVFKI